MLDNETVDCPECELGLNHEENLNRRYFLRLLGAGAVSLAAGKLMTPQLLASQPATVPAQVPGPAEGLVRELYQGLSDDQKRSVAFPWDHGAGPNQLPARLRFYNGPISQDVGRAYSRPQQELVQRIVRGICAEGEGYDRIATVVEQDNFGRSWQGAGATFFGDPNQGPFAWLFTAHHLTLRCAGNSEPNAAFGGPLYYGHFVDGLSQRNVFNYQTRWARHVFDALSEAQRKRAVVLGSPGEMYASVRFRAPGQPMPGLPAADLTADQRQLVQAVMREVLSPFRSQDADNVMNIVGRNGGLERLHLAFYRDRNATDNTRWHFWRLEGPGFVWNYRILPHVHCYVNIAAQQA